MLPAEKVRRGVLITFEGPDGSGKSTQIRVLADKLKEEGCNVLLTREPGGTEIGEQIRAVLHDTKNTAMQPRAEVLLYCAARAQLVGQIVRPHLGGGGLVLSDRYFDSTLAYQGYGHGMDIGALRHIVDFATGGLEPDLTLLLDVDPEIGLKRRRGNSEEMNRMDLKNGEFYVRARKGFQAMASEGGRWRVVDASKSKEEVGAEVWAVVMGFLKSRAVGLLGI